jgi:hypothetical protein
MLCWPRWCANRPRSPIRRSIVVAAGLLFRQGVPPHASYLFKHALVQDTAYPLGSISPGTRCFSARTPPPPLPACKSARRPSSACGKFIEGLFAKIERDLSGQTRSLRRAAGLSLLKPQARPVRDQVT